MHDAAFETAVRANWQAWGEAVRRVKQRPDSGRRIHEFRVATRRLLAMEDLLGPARVRRQATLAQQVGPAFRAAGKLRDAQLACEALRGLRSTHPVAARIETTLRQQLPRRVRRFSSALAELDVAACKRAVRRLQPGKEQHRLRLQVKRLRYMQDWLASLPDGVASPDLRADLTKLQAGLGRLADARALQRTIERWAPPDAAAARARARLTRSVTPHTGRRRRGLK